VSVLDIWNDAAAQISNETIGSLDEDSPIANACRELWPSIRDHLLSLANWKFSERRRVLSPPSILLESIAAGHERSRIISLPAAFQESDYRFLAWNPNPVHESEISTHINDPMLNDRTGWNVH